MELLEIGLMAGITCAFIAPFAALNSFYMGKAFLQAAIVFFGLSFLTLTTALVWQITKRRN